MIIGLGLGIPFRKNYAVRAQEFTPAILFGTSDQGVWYDPSDFSTLFQDSAGTTPVTALEQPVGRMLDKSGKGNHATQPTATSRPVVSARVNLLTKTEQFNDGAWARGYITPAAGKLTPTTSNNFHGISQSVTYTATGFTGVIEAKADGYQYLQILLLSGSNYVEGVFNLSGAGAVENTSRNVGWTGTRSIELLPDGYYRCTVTVNTASAASGVYQVGVFPTNDPTTVFAGNGTSGILVRKPDLRVANDGVNLPPYQRVNTATDYDSVGFPVYLRCDGVDDGMVTNSIDFTGTDKMTVVAGVRKLSDSAVGMVVELGPDAAFNNGVLNLNTSFTGSGAGASYGLQSRGTIRADAIVNGYIAPTTNILTGIGNISGDSAILRVNAIQAAISTADQGTGNFGKYPLYLFRRGGSSLPFNGRFYGLTIVNKLLSTAELEQLETYTNGKTRAYV